MSAIDELTQILRAGPGRGRHGTVGGLLLAAVAATSLGAALLFGGLWAAVACLPLVAAVGWVCGGRWALSFTAVAALVPAFAGEPSVWVGVGHAIARTFILLHAAAGATLVRAALQRASAAAETDRLTGLLNRTGFVARLGAESNRARRSNWPLAVGFLDCDNFKQVNDTLGHLAGDEVLRLTAAAIDENVRNYDSSARFGGDEFVVLWPVLSAAGAEASARRLHDVLTATIEAAGYDVSFSIGVAVFEEIPEAAEVLDQADRLMYEVKKSGKGRVMTRVFRGRSAGRA